MGDIMDEASASARFVGDVFAGALAVCGGSSARTGQLTDLSLAAPRAARRRAARLQVGLPASPVLDIPVGEDPVDWGSALTAAAEAGAVFVVPLGEHDRYTDPAFISALGAHRRLVVPLIVDDRRLGPAEAASIAGVPNLVPLHFAPADRAGTDAVIGVGAWAATTFAMDALTDAGCLQGVVVPVTSANLDEVLEAERLRTYVGLGCRIVILVQASLMEDLPLLGGRPAAERPSSSAQDHVRRVLSLRLPTLRAALAPALVLDCSYLAPGRQMDGFPGRCVDGFAQAL